MDNQLLEWNNIFLTAGEKKPRYDDWLQKHHACLEASKDTPIIDLGCGFGNDTLYLTERGYKVISCDYAVAALDRLKHFVEEPQARLFNMLDGLPFGNGTAHILIADLSIHYFSWEDTRRIIREISRVLVKGGYFLCRVNSVNDVNYGAGRGIRIEENYYDVDGWLKRFFDAGQLSELFTDWEIVHMEEYEMHRYRETKAVWELAARNTCPGDASSGTAAPQQPSP